MCSLLHMVPVVGLQMVYEFTSILHLTCIMLDDDYIYYWYSILLYHEYDNIVLCKVSISL